MSRQGRGLLWVLVQSQAWRPGLLSSFYFPMLGLSGAGHLGALPCVLPQDGALLQSAQLFTTGGSDLDVRAQLPPSGAWFVFHVAVQVVRWPCEGGGGLAVCLRAWSLSLECRGCVLPHPRAQRVTSPSLPSLRA